MPLDRGRARVLFLSDTHLGLDLPQHPRVARRRRGPDFFASFERALGPAVQGEIDLVVHGGDVLFRSRVPPGLVARAFAPLKRVADGGVPVCVVPGNHERSRIPHPELARHPGILVFDRPRTFRVRAGGLTLALAGFPFVRHGLRDGFRGLVESTAWRDVSADARLLCVHQCIEGATVGPRGFTFRDGDDVIRAGDLPRAFAGILAGHVHRFQALTRDLRGRLLPVPVLYAGSTERTSFAERDEGKGFLRIDVEADGSGRGRLRSWQFHGLPTRPMVQLDLPADRLERLGLAPTLANVLGRQHPDAVVRLKIHGRPPDGSGTVLRAAALRGLAPPTMNVSVRLAGDPTFRCDT
jgi:DNA repair exonuclease SbcCD nuclease subunit